MEYHVMQHCSYGMDYAEANAEDIRAAEEAIHLARSSGPATASSWHSFESILNRIQHPMILAATLDYVLPKIEASYRNNWIRVQLGYYYNDPVVVLDERYFYYNPGWHRGGYAIRDPVAQWAHNRIPSLRGSSKYRLDLKYR